MIAATSDRSTQPPAVEKRTPSATWQFPVLGIPNHITSVRDGTERIRKIIHIDTDALYASTEQRDNPTLKGRPAAVGYPIRRGVVAAASYEARRFAVNDRPAEVRARAEANTICNP